MESLSIERSLDRRLVEMSEFAVHTMVTGVLPHGPKLTTCKREFTPEGSDELASIPPAGLWDYIECLLCLGVCPINNILNDMRN